MNAPLTAERSRLHRRGLILAALTIAWNVIEAVVAITAGIAAGSIALVGFGFDSTIEVGSAVVVVWQFRAEQRGGYDENRGIIGDRRRQPRGCGPGTLARSPSM